MQRRSSRATAICAFCSISSTSKMTRTSGRYPSNTSGRPSTGWGGGVRRTIRCCLSEHTCTALGTGRQWRRTPSSGWMANLEEGKKGEELADKPIPNAIHLVRRGDFLLSILREHDEKLRSYESSLRIKGLKVSASPPPIASTSSSAYNMNVKRCAESEAVASVDDGSSHKRKRRPTPTFTDSESSDEFLLGAFFGLLTNFRRWTRLQRRSCDQ
ncbi:hypothetical protein B0H13DRAFT_775674 [Mycena leptocephala]|nr:hypothetical protein B0H13DRAFT_775674 [Mycena leptocephala]